MHKYNEKRVAGCFKNRKNCNKLNILTVISKCYVRHEEMTPETKEKHIPDDEVLALNKQLKQLRLQETI